MIDKIVIDGDWIPIKDYENLYEIHPKGTVRSCDRKEWVDSIRTGGHFRKRSGAIMRTGKVCNSGYHTIQLCKNGKSKRFLIHRLVASNFIENPNNLPEVNHIDEDKLNNNVSNLEWTDRSGNAIHSVKKFRGENSGTVKLKENEVIDIVSMLNQGVSQTEIAKIFNVSNHAIHKIKCGKNWGWLTGLGKEGSCQ